MSTRRPQRVRLSSSGFSIIEIIVVIAIVAGLLGSAVYGFRAVARTDLRTTASKLAGAIRYCFDRSITTGAYYRIVLDLDGNKYWAERSDDRFYLARDKETAPGRGQAFDRDAYEKELDEQEKKEDEAFQQQAQKNSLGIDLQPPPRPRRAKFQTFKDTTLPTVTLKRTRLFDVYTPRQPEPYSKGRAYLYFFPDGHTERAVVRMQDGDAWYSLIVHPLTGRVEVQNGKYEIPRDFDDKQEVR